MRVCNLRCVVSMAPKSNFDNLEQCFRILGLPTTASLDEIKKRYRHLAKAFHPDSYPDSHSKEEAAKRFREITEAYKKITNWKNFEQAFRKFEEAASYDEPNRTYQANEQSRKESEKKDKVTSSKSTTFLKLTEQLKNIDRKTSFLLGALMLIAFLVINWPSSETSLERKGKELPTGIKPIVVSSEPQRSKLSKGRNSSVPPASDTHDGSFFTIGSPEDHVLMVQGPPDKKTGQVWNYGLSRITFRDGKVVGYDNFDGSLKVRLLPKTNFQDGEVPQYFTLGSSEDEVLIIQGMPSRVAKDVWYYGLDRVLFKDNNGMKVVSGYDNIAGSLKVRIVPQSAEDSMALKRGYFTVGDSPDDVLALQGMPQRVEQNRWFYGAYYVVFDRGRVLNVGPVPGDGGGVLKFLAKQPTTQNGVQNGR